MSVDAKLVAELRKMTGAGMMDCKKALEENAGDMEKSIEYLRKKGIQKAEKRSGREANEGIITSYIHANKKIGALVELHTETDFVARNEEFQNLAKDIAMHVVAASPSYLTSEQVPAEELEKEKEIYREQLKAEGKTDDIIEKILEGKIKKYYQQVCLMEQEFIKDDKKNIADLINEKIGKIGEKIELKNFTRFEI